MGLATKLVPGLDEILKIANKFIPDKDAQIELEKKALEVNQEIIKSNKTVLEKVIPLTFPVMCWFLTLYGLLYATVGVYTFFKVGEFMAIPFPEPITKLAMIFACGLMGKWNIEKLTGHKGDK